VVGLARTNSLPDLVVDLVSAAANPVMGLIKHPRPTRLAGGPAAGQPVMPGISSIWQAAAPPAGHTLEPADILTASAPRGRARLAT
jgi:hypothetical protein